MNLIETLKNIAYSFGANLVSLGISVFMVMFVPKFLSVDDYGLWQLFLFYFSYLGFLHFGWEDGIYLRYAGKNFKDLDSMTFAGQFYGIIALQIILLILVIGVSNILLVDPIKKTALTSAICLAPLVNFNTLCNFIMQITNRIKEYARLLLAERILFFIGVLLSLLVWQQNEFRYMYYAKIFSLVSVTLLSSYLCKRLLKPKLPCIKVFIYESKENLVVGSKLMLANIAGMLIIGIVRYGISVGWDIATFGKISLTLGISNFLMVFISSISVVFFPIIKRMDESKRADSYQMIRTGFDVILFGILITYYPLKYILTWWLPKYADSLIYMSILFPICVFTSKLSLLVNTYLKSMRREALMLKINSISVGIAIAATFITVDLFHDLNFTLLSVVAVYAFQCCLAEFFIGRMLNLHLLNDILVDIFMCSVFIISGWYIPNIWCTVIYTFAYITFLLLYRKPIQRLVQIYKK